MLNAPSIPQCRCHHKGYGDGKWIRLGPPCQSRIRANTATADGNSNLTSDGTFTFGYDAENRLVSAVGAGNTAAYGYDAQGRRKTRTVNGTTTVFVTDASNREVLEYDGASGAIQRWYAYGLGSNDVVNQSNVVAGTRAALIPDIQGSVIASLDSGSGTLSRSGYLPYGKSASTTAPFGYTAQRIDPETNGLYYYRSRHYSPAWGRFLQADPIGFAGGIHLYAYVNSDPLNNTDPSGRWAGIDDLIFTGGGAVIGAAGQVLANVVTGNYDNFWRGVTAAAVGGAAAGETTLYAGPVAGGIAGGLASNATKAGWDLAAGTFNETSLGSRLGATAFDSTVGAGIGWAFQGAGAVIPGIDAGRNSFSAIGDSLATKFENGTISSLSASSAAKWFIGSSVKDAALEGSTAAGIAGNLYEDATSGSNGQATSGTQGPPTQGPK